MFRLKGVHMCTWQQDISRCSLISDFVVASSNLQPHVLDTWMVAKAKIWWGHGERHLDSFRKVVDHHPGSGKGKAVYSGDGVLLTLTQDNVDPWKEYYKDLFNSTKVRRQDLWTLELALVFQFSFLCRAPFITKLSLGESESETQSQNPQVSTVARKNSLLTGRNLEQDPAHREEPSCWESAG